MRYLFGMIDGKLHIILRFGENTIKNMSLDPVEPILKMIAKPNVTPSMVRLEANTIENAYYVLTKLGYEVIGDIPKFEYEKGKIY